SELAPGMRVLPGRGAGRDLDDEHIDLFSRRALEVGLQQRRALDRLVLRVQQAFGDKSDRVSHAKNDKTNPKSTLHSALRLSTQGIVILYRCLGLGFNSPTASISLT